MWIKCKDQMPVPSATHDGRVPVLDSDGFLVIALLHNGHFICETTPVCWMPVPHAEIED